MKTNFSMTKRNKLHLNRLNYLISYHNYSLILYHNNDDDGEHIIQIQHNERRIKKIFRTRGFSNKQLNKYTFK